jgi:hypothetical protein
MIMLIHDVLHRRRIVLKALVKVGCNVIGLMIKPLNNVVDSSLILILRFSTYLGISTSITSFCDQAITIEGDE